MKKCSFQIFALLVLLTMALCGCEKATPQRNTSQEILNNHASFSAKISPEFTWSAFQRFWHRGADARVSLQGIKKEGAAYSLDYGHGVILTIHMQDDLVSGMSIEYLARSDTYDGGQQFLRLMQHMLLVGTFRWTHAERAALFKHFEVMTQEKRQYVLHNSYFIREYNVPLWTFDLIFIEKSSLQKMP